MSSSYDFNVLIKEYMAKMPDDLKTKKEIDEYYKIGSKDINDKIKEEIKANKAAQKKDGPAKRVKKVNLDEDGNEIEKVKKPPTEYQQFMRDTKDEVKGNFPELKNNERFAKIAELWRKHKEDKAKESDTKIEEEKKEDDKNTIAEGKAPRKPIGTKKKGKKEEIS